MHATKTARCSRAHLSIGAAALLTAALLPPAEALAEAGLPPTLRDVQLGSELAWTSIGGGSSRNLATAAGGRDRVVVLAITTDGNLWTRWSARYTGAFQTPAGCTTPLACWGDYRSSQQRETVWEDWVRPVPGHTFALRRPLAVADSAGRVHLFVARATPTVGISYFVAEAGVLTAVPFPAADGLVPTRIEAVPMGDEPAGGPAALLVSVQFFGGSFRLFQIGQRPVARPPMELSFPAGREQTSFTTSTLSGYGEATRRAAIAYRNADWKATHFALSDDGRVVVEGDQIVYNLAGVDPPQMLWLPGNYLVTVQQDVEGHLRGSYGSVFGNQLLPLGAARFTTQAAAAQGFRLFRHANDVLVVARLVNGATELYRFDLDNGPQFRFTRVGAAIPGPSIFTTSDVVPVLVDREIYAVTAESSGNIAWINLQRRTARDQMNDHRLFPRVNPNLGRAASDMFNYSELGIAFRAVPQAYRELFRRQPESSCHPVGFSPPLVCGQVYLTFDDFDKLGAPAGNHDSYSELRRCLMSGPNPFTCWQLFVMKAFPGAVILKTPWGSTKEIFHELMHLVDYQVINGDLVPAEAARLRPDFNVLFNNRAGAGVDGVRARGFISDYAETNATEDWAESAAYYRFSGETFRQLALRDFFMLDWRLALKYDFLHRKVFHVEYSDEGTPR
jgi:hypothetical protein